MHLILNSIHVFLEPLKCCAVHKYVIYHNLYALLYIILEMCSIHFNNFKTSVTFPCISKLKRDLDYILEGKWGYIMHMLCSLKDICVGYSSRNSYKYAKLPNVKYHAIHFQNIFALIINFKADTRTENLGDI